MDLLVLVAPLLMAQAPALLVGTPMPQVHQQLLTTGWSVSSEAKDSEPLSPRQSHLKQRIPALITCSGTGSGYCAYGYSRQGQNLKVVASSDGPLLRWQLGEAWYGEGLSQQ